MYIFIAIILELLVKMTQPTNFVSQFEGINLNPKSTFVYITNYLENIITICPLKTDGAFLSPCSQSTAGGMLKGPLVIHHPKAI